MSIETIYAETRRRAIVDLLAEAQDYEIYEQVLEQAVGALRLPSAGVADDLPWLEGEGLITLKGMAPARRARLTALGLDVSRGLMRVHGLGRKLG